MTLITQTWFLLVFVPKRTIYYKKENKKRKRDFCELIWVPNDIRILTEVKFLFFGVVVLK